MKNFADFWRGMFYLCASVAVGVLLYMMIVVWQPLWTTGFSDFNSISLAIARLDQTTKPAVDLVPHMLQQMDLMNHNMQQMNQSLDTMNQNVNQMRLIMGYQMGNMNHQMDQINDKFTPFGMMPFNW